MASGNFHLFDPNRVPTPCFVIDRARLEQNLQCLNRIGTEAGVKVLLALKAFSSFAHGELISRYLDGTAASGLYEAKLGKRHFAGEVHTFAPGLKPDELDEALTCSGHLVFNSLEQYRRFEPMLPSDDRTQFGLRINPRHQEVENPLYDPAAPWSRLGVDAKTVEPQDMAPFSGIHVHALCDHGIDAFSRYLQAVEQNLAHLFGRISWVNLGGGVLFTDDGFPVDEAISLLAGFRERTGLTVYIEPGTAVALHAGAMVTEVLDVSMAAAPVAVVDASATCHMPDVIEAPFTPECLGASSLARTLQAHEVNDPAVLRIGGPTCLAGDVIGTYRFLQVPENGDRLVFLDLAYYTMVKATTFNGTPLPAQAVWDARDDSLEVVRTFGYEDFESRLG